MAVGGLLLYYGIGNIVKLILEATVSTGSMVVKLLKDKQSNDVLFDVQTPTILTVLGFLVSGVGFSVLVTYLIS